MTREIPVTADAVMGRDLGRGLTEVTPTLAYLRTAIVNVGFLGVPGRWFLIDAGIPGARGAIERVAAQRFGGPPTAILLTHGHFDHVGAIEALAKAWSVRVYAHPAEHPYLNGTESYPPAQPRLRDGLMSLLSPLYPRRPVNVGGALHALPPDGSLPDLDDWTWIATPGHTPGHVSFWHARDKLVIAGDAFISTAQESAYAVARQVPEIHGPPRYFTPDWHAAATSVARLAALEPRLAVTGHGPALHGPALTDGLHRLSERFREVAVPQ